MGLAGKTVALAEGRQLEELAALLEKEGAVPLRCPLLAILDPVDDGPAVGWLRFLAADRFSTVVLLTGEGVRRLAACAERHGMTETFGPALARTRTVIRGPKPAKALAEFGVKASLVAPAPTTDGVIAAMRSLPLQGETVGVQLYRETNPPLTDFLAAQGATAMTVLPYVIAPAADGARVADLIARMAAGNVDVAVFTSAPQVERLFDVATEQQNADTLRAGLARTKVAAVGPLVAESLANRKVRVDVCPESGWQMKNLVVQIRRAMGD